MKLTTSNLWSAPDKRKALSKQRSELFSTDPFVWYDLIGKHPQLVAGRVLDPSAGSGHLIKCILSTGNLYSHGLYDLRKICFKQWKQAGIFNLMSSKYTVVGDDWLTLQAPVLFDNAITNPPFSVSLHFIDQMLDWTKPKGHVTILQRTNFQEGIGRSKFFVSRPLYKIINIPYRISFFVDEAETQAFTFPYGFSFYVFKKTYTGTPTVHWL